MSERLDRFDPYHKWLGIPPSEQPPNHYRLLGVAVFEDDADVVASAADRQMAHVRTFQAGPHSADSQKLLNELSAARLCLLKPAERGAYDSQLRRRLAAPSQHAPPQPLPVQMVSTPPRPLAAAPSVRWAQAPAAVGAHVRSPSVVEPRIVIDKYKISSRPRTYRRRPSGWPLAGVVTLAGAIFVGIVIWRAHQERSRRHRQGIAELRPTTRAPSDDVDVGRKRPLEEDPMGPDRTPLDADNSIDGTLHMTDDDSANDDNASDEAIEATQPPAANGPEPRETTAPAEFSALVAEVAPDFTTYASGSYGVGIVAEHFGRRGVLRTHPVALGEPCVLAATVDVLAGKQTNLVLDVSHHPHGDWQLVVKANGSTLHDSIVGPTTATNGWIEVVVDLQRFAGQQIELELLNQANDWRFEFGFWGRVEIEVTPLIDRGAVGAAVPDERSDVEEHVDEINAPPGDNSASTARKNAAAAARRARLRPEFLSQLPPRTAIGFLIPSVGVRTNNNAPLVVAGRSTPHGIFAPPPAGGYSTVTYALKTKAQSLSFEVGLDDGSSNKLPTPPLFEVLGDGKVIWTKTISRKGYTEKCEDLDVSRVRVLELRVNCSGVDRSGTGTVWFEPRVTWK